MRRTEKYRELLLKQRKSFLESFEKLFLSMEMILDNVDQEFEQKRIAKQDKKANERKGEI